MSDDLVDDKVTSITDLILAAAHRAATPTPADPARAAAPPAPPVPPAADGELEAAELVRQELARKSDPMPESPLEPYRPHAGFLNRLKSQERTFYCVFQDCTYRGFPYAQYDGIRLERAAAPGGGLEVVVRFNGSQVEEVRLAGRGLRFVALCIGLGIMPWVWERPDGRAAAGDAATVITAITIVKIERT